ncbi:magnesium and cobalt efflux protein CorC [Clostridium puniceum]|uniref:Magnesium and cobalt efflux protein CorC n=1 Tax=Clostridium puniceum TaxID=29367 RepID=A0A1S8TXW1_9CLOT|nr:hemolysin family protein [Clostridium puniceum]OOM82459.1 magnesium and cobalt efflux protein CorC [Clostridium puniceum]
MEGEVAQTNNMVMQIIFLVALTLINAFFASAEMAIVSVNKNKMKMLASEGDKKAQILCKLMEEPTKFLSTIQVGITLAGFFASASAATGISTQLGKALNSINIPYGDEIAFIGVTIILSYFTLVFGELVPKRIALRKSESIAMFSLKPIIFISKIAAPFIKVLSLSTSLLVKILGLDSENLDEIVTREELKSFIETGEEQGAINESEKEMIEGIIEFDNKKIEKVMTPRTKVYCINIKEPLNSYLDELLEMRYSRVPVYEDDIDNVMGILYMKDFIIEAKDKGFDNVDIKKILKEPYFVHGGKKVQDLFKSLQASQRHIAIIIDEYGGFSGIITIEDLLEEIVGEINDEDDSHEETIRKIDENTFLVDGLTTLEELNDKLNLDIKLDADIDTISGFLINLIGNIPSEEDEKIIEYNDITFKIDKLGDKRIETILISKT